MTAFGDCEKSFMMFSDSFRRNQGPSPSSCFVFATWEGFKFPGLDLCMRARKGLFDVNVWMLPAPSSSSSSSIQSGSSASSLSSLGRFSIVRAMFGEETTLKMGEVGRRAMINALGTPWHMFTPVLFGMQESTNVEWKSMQRLFFLPQNDPGIHLSTNSAQNTTCQVLQSRRPRNLLIC